MRVAELTRSTSRLNGGIFFAQTALSSRVARLSPPDEIRVFGAADEFTEADRAAWAPVQVEAIRAWPPCAFGYSPGWLRALRAFAPDVVHVHGVWHYSAFAGLRLHRQRATPMIVSPHGMLDPGALAFSAGRKKWAARFFQDEQLHAAAVLRALNRAEADAMRAYGLKNPIAVIPNGVDLPASTTAAVPPWKTAGAPRRTLLFLGRLHPKKGLDVLVDAWTTFVQSRPPGAAWRLVIAGWNELGFEERLRAQAQALLASGAIEFVGPLWGAQKEAAYAACDAFVLPSLSEGLPMTVLEAWSHGKPALITAACNLPEGVRAGAALELAASAAGVLAGLDTLAAMTDEGRRAMGAQGRQLVQDRFTWSKIAADMSRLHVAIAAREPVPSDLLFAAT